MCSKILLEYQKVIVSLIFLIVCSFSLDGQVNISSPSAAEVVRYERVPVSYFNGLPSIDIPLYTIQSKDITFPISLSYHASGIKVNQYPTMVGLGWNMNLGAITRVVNGLPDETCGSDIHKNDDVGYYFSSGRLDSDAWLCADSLEFYHYKNHNGIKYDTEPDEFVINAYGISGSFYFYRDRNGHIHSRIKSNNGDSFKVELPVLNENVDSVEFHGDKRYTSLTSYRIYNLFNGFTVIKNDGTKLVFGKDTDCIEFYSEIKSQYYDGSNINECYFKTWPSAWLLKEIVSPKGNKITFTYHRNGNPVIISDVITDFMVTDEKEAASPILPDESSDRGKTFIIQHPLYPESIITSDSLEVSFYTEKDNDLETVSVSDRQFLNEKVFTTAVIDNVMYSDNNAPKKILIEPHNYSCKLSKINISHRSKYIKTIDLQYIDNASERLKLQKLIIGAGYDNSEQAYQFYYNSQKLPPYNATVTDNWGYWNNKDYRKSVLKNDFYNFRSSDLYYTKAESLTEIVYPTGGSVELDYELNDYSKIATQAPEFSLVEQNGIAGGLRIKQVKYCTDSTEYVHSFEYKNIDGTSSGILSGIPKYYAQGANHLNFEYSTWWGLLYLSAKADISQYYYMDSEAYINTLGLTTGNHVTYSRVVESIGKTNPLRKEYLYTNHDSHPDTADFAMLTNIDNVTLDNKFTSRGLLRGLLTNEVWYNGEVKVKEIVNGYNVSNFEYDKYLKCIDQFYISGLSGYIVKFPFARYAPYKILTFYPYLTSRIENTYDPTGTVVISSQEEHYTYNNNLLLKKKVRKDSKGHWETTSITYPDEYRSGIYTDMTARNMISYPVETTTSVSSKITSASLNEYKAYHSNILSEKTWKLNLVESLDSTDFTQYYVNGKDQRYVLDSEVVDYDKSGNPLHICDNHGIHTSYEWGYGASFPTAQTINAANTYKRTTEYTPRVKMDRIDLDPDYISTDIRNYTFTTYQTGEVTVNLGGALGYDWFVNGTMDSNGFTLVQLRSGLPQEEPWDRYATAYTHSVTFTSVPAGQHTLSLKNTSVRAGNLATGESGGLTYTYHGADAYVVEEGQEEFLFENFEDSHLSGIYPFGYHSNACYVGKYSINLKGDSDRAYILDYRVYENGEWNYVRTNMEGRGYVIDEGMNPIDDVRVYPEDTDMMTFSWKPYIGMWSRTNSAGITESYAYDCFGRLESIKDNNGDVVRQYRYNYVSSSLSAMPSEYYNEPISMTFHSSACDKNLGNLSVPVDYTIPARKYVSTVSQIDANRMAFDDLVANGQAYADTHGTCEPHIVVSVYNASRSPMTIQCAWRENGIIQEILFPIPQSDQVGTSGIINEDYLPQTIYLPRENYLYVKILNEDMQEIPFISESGHNCGFMYSEEDFPGYRDTYMIR